MDTSALLSARGTGGEVKISCFFSAPKERVLFLLDMTYYGMAWFMGLDREEISILVGHLTRELYMQVMG